MSDEQIKKEDTKEIKPKEKEARKESAEKIKENKSKEIKDGTDIFDDEDEMEFDKAKEKETADVPEETVKKDAKDTKEKKGKKSKKKKKKKEIRRIPNGRAYVQATYNNTIISLTDQAGNTLIVGSAGQLGFKGPKKSTPYAASIVVRDLVNKIKDYGLQNVAVYVKGVGAGREAAVRALNANGLNILSIKDQTPIPHNGCRPKKPRRV